jgi:hypothetical protein
MSDHDITHREIYDRLVAVEGKVDAIADSTKDVVKAFEAAQGAFTVLEWLAKAAKPLLWLGGLVAAVVTFWDHLKVK